MMRIAVCISTRKRIEGLLELLSSINSMKIPDQCDVTLVIIENDDRPNSEEAVGEFAKKSKFRISYFLETNRGISYARNRSVKESGDCDFCCFVDDDQIVDENMLVELIKCQMEFNADAVSGSTPALFRFSVPEYIRNFHEESFREYGERLDQAATGCLLIRKSYLDRIDGPFDLRLNFTGGEDFYMTYLVTGIGGIIVANPGAISYEIIPPDRATVKYVIKRTIRTANTKNVVQSLTGQRLPTHKALPKIIIRLVRGLLIAIPYYFFCKNDRLKGIFKISYSVGELMFIFGKNSKFYR